MQIRHLSGTYSARETLNTFALQDQTTQFIIKGKTWIICDQKGTTKIPVHEKELEREGIEQSDTHTHTRRREKRNIQSHIFRKQPNNKKKQKNKKNTERRRQSR